MPLDDLDHFLKIVIGLLVVVEAVGQLLQCLEEAVQVHLVVVAPPHYVLVNYVVVSLQYVAVGEPRVLRQFLKLRTRDEVVALLPGQDLEHLLRVGVQVQFIQLPVRQGQYFREEALLLQVAQLLVGRSNNLDCV